MNAWAELFTNFSIIYISKGPTFNEKEVKKPGESSFSVNALEKDKLDK